MKRTILQKRKLLKALQSLKISTDRIPTIAYDYGFATNSNSKSTLLSWVFGHGMRNVVGDFLNGIKIRKINIKSWEQFMARIENYVEHDEKVDQKIKLDQTMVKE